MKKITLLLALNISVVSLFAQADSLLKQFKYRISQFRAVSFNAGGGSQYSRVDFVTNTVKNSASSAGFNGMYYVTKSTDKIQLTATANISSNFSRNKSSDLSNSNKSNNFSAAPQLSILNRWFSKKIFTELGADISADYNSTKTILQGYPAAGKYTQKGYFTTLTLGIGKGRLENVTDMQNALWLYKELQQEQRLSRSLSATDLTELGKSITRGNNTRVLDGRKKTKFLLSTVDQYLQQKGLVSKTDINYFTSLNDILFYAYNNVRLAGTEKFIRLNPSVSDLNDRQLQPNGIQETKHLFNTRSAALSIGFKKYMPTSLTHQNNYGAAVNCSYLTGDNTDRSYNNGILLSETKGTTEIKRAGGSIFYEHAIYPNTRTNINFNLQSDLGYQDIDGQNFYTATNAGCNVNYFISYHTRLSLGAGVFFQKNNYVISDYINIMPTSFQLYTNAGVQIQL